MPGNVKPGGNRASATYVPLTLTAVAAVFQSRHASQQELFWYRTQRGSLSGVVGGFFVNGQRPWACSECGMAARRRSPATRTDTDILILIATQCRQVQIGTRIASLGMKSGLSQVHHHDTVSVYSYSYSSSCRRGKGQVRANRPFNLSHLLRQKASRSRQNLWRDCSR